MALTTGTTIQDLIDANPDALVVVDIAGAIALVNRPAEQLLGYTRGELLGQPFAVLVSDHNHEVWLNLLVDSADALSEWNPNPVLEVVARRKDGGNVPVEVSLNGLETGGRKLVVAAVRDVSARKHLEQERLRLLAGEQTARAEAEAAVRLRDAFLATVTHDLRQPLTAIKARAQLIHQLATELGGDPTAQQIRAYANGISDGSASINLVLQELRDVSRLQIGQPLILDRTPTDLAELARRVADEQHLLDRARISIQTPAEAVMGVWDETRLERVLHHLLSNAVKYSPHGGQVTLSVKRDEDSAVLEVTDDGIGIPAADVDHVFEWFRRGSNVLSVAPGVGLGLAGVRQIVHQHGGVITVRSEEGKGSTVTVRLPMDQ